MNARSEDEGQYANSRSSYGFSYRGQWVSEGCPGTIEAWLVNNNSAHGNGISTLIVKL
ncbi:hypothetical protein GCM10007864_55360 [Sinorhizobium fredii]|nr:hypothetical protein GCM10007864_55360 [Sinorhizobium fredii]